VRAKVILTVVVGLLLCTLSTLEFPEFLKLIDDTSNDYLVTQVQDAVPPAARKEAPRTSSPIRIVQTSSRDPRPVHPGAPGRVASAGDFLHWICILRT
jgi:hypothetical protein